MKRIYKNVNPTKLVDELLVRVQMVGATSEGNTLEIEFVEGVNMDLVQHIVDAHNPTPVPTPLSDIEKLRMEQAQANSELVQLIMMMGGV